jgi:toxin CcdB
MAQFQLYRNLRASREQIPYLLDVQADVVETGTRLVLPVIPRKDHGPVYTRLHPVVDIEGQAFVVVTSDVAAVSSQSLRPPVVADLSAHRQALLDALDFLLTGY